MNKFTKMAGLVLIAFIAIFTFFTIIHQISHSYFPKYHHFMHKIESEEIRVSDILQIRSAPFYLGVEKGFYKKHGINLTIIPITKGSLAIQEVLDRKLDIAVAAPGSVIPFMAKNSDIEIIGVMHTSGNNATIVGRKDLGIEKITDLKNKKIAVQYGADGHFFLVQTLIKNNISLDDVEIIDVKNKDMMNSLMTGKVDAVSVWQPYSTSIRDELKENATIFSGDETYYSLLILIAKKSWVKSNKNDVVKFLQATKDSIDYIDSNNEEAFQFISKKSIEVNPLWTEETLRDVWESSIFELNLKVNLIQKLKSVFNIAKTIKIIDPNTPAIDFSQFINPKPLREVSPNSVSIY